MRLAGAQVAAVINADDFGISPRVSQDIVACFEAGRITSTTVIANAPDFEGACALAKRHGFADRVGVHLNLTFGPPLSEAMQQVYDGAMAVRERRLLAPREVLEAVEAEFRAQILRVVSAGIEPSHIDSHQHIINGFPYARVALRVAKEFGIARVRLTRNAFYRKSMLKWLYKTSYNSYLRVAGMRTVRYFADLKPYFKHVSSGGRHLRGPVELMCHPGAQLPAPLGHADTETGLLLGKSFGDFLETVRLISYREV